MHGWSVFQTFLKEVKAGENTLLLAVECAQIVALHMVIVSEMQIAKRLRFAKSTVHTP